MKVLLFGSTGRTGLAIITYLLESPKSHIVTAVARNPSALADHPQHDHKNLRIVKGDLKNASFVEEQVAEHDVVVFAAGMSTVMGGRTPDGIYAESAKTIRRAILQAQRVSDSQRKIRFIGVTSGGIRPGNEVNFPFIYQFVIKPLFLQPSYDEMVLMEREFRDPDQNAEEIDWSFVQPPRLTDVERTGNYRVEAEKMIVGGCEIGRKDLAAFIVERMVDDETGEFRGKEVTLGY
ncbi:hypothetical protein BC938DRAFT_473546 [Jimgerdemannia flammicorona]|uniref:NAD(P)-binding domain-containing protein n=1 Tax=Jimgerdemannia flammicorona TaxID=994334 RepID=A0A433QT90_9FUNG|nr:hypothetical protein BC938DRAFT_473546 [Jimgerdemannia flammicorona]